MEELKREDLNIARMKRLSVVVMIISIVIIVVSLVYEVIYKEQEGFSGIIIGMVGILISVQLYSTAEIRGEIRYTLRDGMREIRAEIKDVKESIAMDIKHYGDAILKKSK